MAQCPNCKSHSFKIDEVEPVGSRFKINLVACASCDTAIGPLEAEAVGILIYKLAEKLGINLNR